jgi:uncharacterized protein YjbI with pentapeptide repeats
MAVQRVERVSPRVTDGLSADPVVLEDEVEIDSTVLTGDHSGVDVSLVQIDACRINRGRLIGSAFHRARITDCVVDSSELPGVILDDCDLVRVEFRDCRMSGFQAQGSRFRDVAFFRCKLDGANFRMSTWERVEFYDCDLVESDFYGAKLPGTLFQACDLSDTEWSKSSLVGSRLLGSTVERIQGATSLRGVTISGDQVVPVAMSVFAAMDITVGYDE